MRSPHRRSTDDAEQGIHFVSRHTAHCLLHLKTAQPLRFNWSGVGGSSKSSGEGNEKIKNTKNYSHIRTLHTHLVAPLALNFLFLKEKKQQLTDRHTAQTKKPLER